VVESIFFVENFLSSSFFTSFHLLSGWVKFMKENGCWRALYAQTWVNLSLTSPWMFSNHQQSNYSITFFFLVLQLLNIHTWLLNFFLGLGAPWVINLPILTYLLNYIPNLPTSTLPIIFHQPTYCNLHIFQFISYVHTYLLPTYILPSTCLKGTTLLIIGIIGCNLFVTWIYNCNTSWIGYVTWSNQLCVVWQKHTKSWKNNLIIITLLDFIKRNW